MFQSREPPPAHRRGRRPRPPPPRLLRRARDGLRRGAASPRPRRARGGLARLRGRSRGPALVAPGPDPPGQRRAPGGGLDLPARRRVGRERRHHPHLLPGHAPGGGRHPLLLHGPQPGDRPGPGDRRRALELRSRGPADPAGRALPARVSRRGALARCRARTGRGLRRPDLHRHPGLGADRPGRRDGPALPGLRRRGAGGAPRGRGCRGALGVLPHLAPPGGGGRGGGGRPGGRQPPGGRPRRRGAGLRRPHRGPALGLGSGAAPTSGRSSPRTRSGGSSSCPRATPRRTTSGASARASTTTRARWSPSTPPRAGWPGTSRPCTTISGTTTWPPSPCWRSFPSAGGACPRWCRPPRWGWSSCCTGRPESRSSGWRSVPSPRPTSPARPRHPPSPSPPTCHPSTPSSSRPRTPSASRPGTGAPVASCWSATAAGGSTRPPLSRAPCTSPSRAPCTFPAPPAGPTGGAPPSTPGATSST